MELNNDSHSFSLWLLTGQNTISFPSALVVVWKLISSLFGIRFFHRSICVFSWSDSWYIVFLSTWSQWVATMYTLLPGAYLCIELIDNIKSAPLLISNN